MEAMVNFCALQSKNIRWSTFNNYVTIMSKSFF